MLNFNKKCIFNKIFLSVISFNLDKKNTIEFFLSEIPTYRKRACGNKDSFVTYLPDNIKLNGNTILFKNLVEYLELFHDSFIQNFK